MFCIQGAGRCSKLAARCILALKKSRQHALSAQARKLQQNLLLPVSESCKVTPVAVASLLRGKFGRGSVTGRRSALGQSGSTFAPSAVPRKPLVLLPVCHTKHTAVRTSASDKPAKIGNAPAQTNSLPEHVARLPYQKEVALLRPNAESFWDVWDVLDLLTPLLRLP